MPVENQIRTYSWCNPPRIGRQRIRPALFTVRDRGASLSKAKWATDEGDLLLAHGEIYKARFAKALARLKQLVERQARHQLSFRRGMQQVAPHLQLAVCFAATLWLTGSPAPAASADERDGQETGHQQSLCEILAKGVTLVALWNGHVACQQAHHCVWSITGRLFETFKASILDLLSDH